MMFRGKLWKAGTGVVITIPQTFIKSGMLYDGQEVMVEVKDLSFFSEKSSDFHKKYLKNENSVPQETKGNTSCSKGVDEK